VSLDRICSVLGSDAGPCRLCMARHGQLDLGSSDLDDEEQTLVSEPLQLVSDQHDNCKHNNIKQLPLEGHETNERTNDHGELNRRETSWSGDKPDIARRHSRHGRNQSLLDRSNETTKHQLTFLQKLIWIQMEFCQQPGSIHSLLFWIHDTRKRFRILRIV
jgi:hypothetical protein